jgi:hypothetical protein
MQWFAFDSHKHYACGESRGESRDTNRNSVERWGMCLRLK